MQERVIVARGVSSEGENRQAPGGLASWLLRQFQAYRSRTASARRELRLVETLPLGGRRCLTLVECGSLRYLVASSGERVEIVLPVESRSVDSRPVEVCG